jgi:uncharacterized protein with GYD domain
MVSHMATYIVLINWTDNGIGDLKNAVSRAQAASEAAERHGGSIRENFWTVGPYDVVSIADFPDDESVTAFLLQAGSLGSIRTTTLRAFNADEMSAIISKVS